MIAPVAQIVEGGLMMLFVMWVNGFKFDWSEVGGFFILLALFAVRDSRRNRDSDFKGQG